MKKIELTNENMTKEFILEKLEELEKEIEYEYTEVNDYGAHILSQIMWGLPNTLPGGLLSIHDIRRGRYNFEHAKAIKSITKRFGISKFNIRKSKLLTIDISTACKLLNALIEYYNYILHTERIKLVTLKSLDKAEYPDRVATCRIIPNDMLEEYLDSISDEDKFYAVNDRSLYTRTGIPGEIIKTTLVTELDGKKYIYQETERTVKERTKTIGHRDSKYIDTVVRNPYSVSQEEYIVNDVDLAINYRFCGFNMDTKEFLEISKRRLKLVITAPEDIIIETKDGDQLVCLKGDYIVIDNIDKNSYSVVSKIDFEATYIKSKTKQKRKRR